MTLLLWSFVAVEGKTRKSGESSGRAGSDRSARLTNRATSFHTRKVGKMFPTIRKSDYTVHMLKEKPRLLLYLSSHSSLEFWVSPPITSFELPSSMPRSKREI
jgi:hypothetical protein